MKKQIIIILCLVFSSLACLTSAIGAEIAVEPSQVATRIKTTVTSAVADPWTEPPSRGGDEIEHVVEPGVSDHCARVIALQTLNLRVAAGTSAEVIGYLENGEEVHVLNDAGAGWWKVQRGEDIGFSRAVYLRAAECED